LIDMASASRERLAAMRRSWATTRVAIGLWILWAIVVWNVIFDRVIVVAGRTYLKAAATAADSGGPYARIDDWMRPAAIRGAWLASAASALIVLIGFCALRLAGARGARR